MKKLGFFIVGFLILGLFFSCVSKPEEKPEPLVEIEEKEQEKSKEDVLTEDEKQVVKEEKTSEQKEKESEVFTPVNFAGNLQKKLEVGKAEDALLLFENVPEEYKEDYSINYMHASLLVSSGDVKKASEVGQKLLEKEPNNVDVLFLNSMVAKRAGDTKKRAELLNKIIAMDPNNSDALVELAHDQMKRGRQSNYRSAKNYYERSVKADDNQLEGWLGYGQASYYLRDDQNAEKAFLKIIEKDPEYSLAYSYLSKISSDKGKIREARSYIEKAIELEPEYYDYWVDYGQSLRLTGDLNGAVKAWTKAIELNPQYFLSYVYRASALDELKKYDESILDYRKIIQLNANYNYAYENLGMLEWKNGNWTKARECFEIALKKDPTSLSYKLMIAASYLREKNREGSKKFIDSHIRNLNKSSAEYYILRLYLDGINPSAVDVRVRKLESVVTKGKMLFYLGLFYDMYGNDEMAKRYYIEVQAMQAPMMFEYQMNEWLLNGECARLYEKKE